MARRRPASWRGQPQRDGVPRGLTGIGSVRSVEGSREGIEGTMPCPARPGERQKPAYSGAGCCSLSVIAGSGSGSGIGIGIGRGRSYSAGMKAAIFDMDGLLIDSEPLWRLAEREVFATVGLELTDEDCRRTTGLRSDEVVDYWYERHPWSGEPCSEVHRRLDARVTELIAERGRTMPGARRAIRLLRGAGLRLALASSSSRELIGVVLDTLGLDEVFEVVASGAEEARGKPDPAVYLTTVNRLRVSAGECLAFEDSVAGVRAARGAGIFTIAVPAPHDIDDPGFDAADLKLRSLEEFRLSILGR